MNNEDVLWRDALNQLAMHGSFLANWKLKNGSFFQMYIPRSATDVNEVLIPRSGIPFSDIESLSILRTQGLGALVVKNDIEACMAGLQTITELDASPLQGIHRSLDGVVVRLRRA